MYSISNLSGTNGSGTFSQSLGLVQGLDGATVDEVLRMPMDLVHRAGLAEILGILRVRGLTGVLHRVKREATQAAIAQAQSQAESVAS